MEYQNIIKTKQYLSRVHEIDKMIQYKQKRIDELSEQISSTKSPNYSDERVQTSPNGDEIPRMVIKLVSLQEEMDADIESLIDAKNDIMRMLDNIQDADAIIVLYKYYFEYKSMLKIAEDMGYSDRTIQRIYRRGIEKLTHYVV